MKFLLFSCLFFASIQASFAQAEFKRVQFENDHFRSYTQAELEKRLGQDSKLLKNFSCDGSKEFKVFTEAVKRNDSGTSLRIQSYEGDSVIYYRQGRLFTLNGVELSKATDKYHRYVKEAFEKLEEIDLSRKLLRQLEHSPYPLTLRFGNNMFVPFGNGKRHQGIYMAGVISFFETLRLTSENTAFYQIGTGGEVLWHPTQKIETIEEDYQKREASPIIALAHELYHAYDAVRGLLDRRHVIGDGYENTSVSEYRAVYFENRIRNELGFMYRRFYTDGKSTDQGMLDEFDEPYLLSSPCLK